MDLTDLLEDLNHASSDVRCNAAGALGALGGDGLVAIEPLVRVACNDADDFVRGEAMHSLWELACSCCGCVAGADEKFAAAIPEIRAALLSDSCLDVRSGAQKLLGEIDSSHQQ